MRICVAVTWLLLLVAIHLELVEAFGGLSTRPLASIRPSWPQSSHLSYPIQRTSLSAGADDSQEAGSRNGSNRNNNSNINNRTLLGRIGQKFIFFFWRGLTLPFPMLRTVDKATLSSQSNTIFSLRECLVAIGAYLSLGAVAYTRVFENWSLVDALYFSVVSFSTVGYGDLCPTNLPSKMFTVGYGLGGVAVLGIAIATIGSSLMEVELEAVEEAQKLSHMRLIDAFEGMPKVLSSFRNGKKADHHDEPTDKQKLIKTEPTPFQYWRKALLRAIPKFIPSFMLMMAGGSIIGHIEGWSWANAIYYSFITGGTLGYGDYAPVTQAGRLSSVIFIPVAVAAAGELLGNVANLMTERRQQIQNDQLLNRKLDMNYLEEMDTDKSGDVDRMEFVTFMLKEMGVVDQSLFDELNKQFDRLDVSDNNSLGIDDLRLMAELRGVAKK